LSGKNRCKTASFRKKPNAQSRKCVGGVMTPPYDGLLDKSKFASS